MTKKPLAHSKRTTSNYSVLMSNNVVDGRSSSSSSSQSLVLGRTASAVLSPCESINGEAGEKVETLCSIFSLLLLFALLRIGSHAIQLFFYFHSFRLICLDRVLLFLKFTAACANSYRRSHLASLSESSLTDEPADGNGFASAIAELHSLLAIGNAKEKMILLVPKSPPAVHRHTFVRCSWAARIAGTPRHNYKFQSQSKLLLGRPNGFGVFIS